MSLHHLDPRKAGTGAAADVEVWLSYDPVKDKRSWSYIAKPGCDVRIAGQPFHTRVNFDSEQSALRAAREAAGFGHVAEKPCATFVCRFHQDHASDCTVTPECRLYCLRCAWSRDAHKGVPS